MKKVGGITLECKECGAFVHNCSTEAVTVTCYDCVNEMMKQYDQPKTKNNNLNTAKGYPKGWRFMKEFVHASGLVYHKGIEQPDLKGTLTPTPIIVKPKKTKAQKAEEKQNALADLAATKKLLLKATKKGEIKKLESKIKKLQKLL